MLGKENSSVHMATHRNTQIYIHTTVPRRLNENIEKELKNNIHSYIMACMKSLYKFSVTCVKKGMSE